MSFAFSAAAASVTNEDDLKTMLTDIASEFNATNGTTKDDVISYVKGKLPNATVWATNGNYRFKQRLATEEKAGFVNMGIGVTLDNVTTELFIFRQDIAPISESQDAVNVTADESMAQNVNQYTVKFNSPTEIVLTVGDTNSKLSVFKDVSADSYYADAVAWTVNNNVTSATTFSPDMTCTRGQIVTFLNRALK